MALVELVRELEWPDCPKPKKLFFGIGPQKPDLPGKGDMLATVNYCDHPDFDMVINPGLYWDGSRNEAAVLRPVKIGIIIPHIRTVEWKRGGIAPPVMTLHMNSLNVGIGCEYPAANRKCGTDIQHHTIGRIQTGEEFDIAHSRIIQRVRGQSRPERRGPER